MNGAAFFFYLCVGVALNVDMDRYISIGAHSNLNTDVIIPVTVSIMIIRSLLHVVLCHPFGLMVLVYGADQYGLAIAHCWLAL